MTESESDIDIQSALPKNKKKIKQPKSPSEDMTSSNLKKVTTKMMIIEALKELKTRKGTSLQAIKKFLKEKHNVNTEKSNYLIKKSIVSGVEDGSFIRMKGTGASGSFKLANVKEKNKKPKPKKETDKSGKDSKKVDKATNKIEKSKKVQIADNMKTKSTKNESEPKKGQMKVAKTKVKENNREEKKTKNKMAKAAQTPAKKRAAMMKRKSIGSIIKPPKMKPKHT